eukprot:jgi/Mesen1/8054/ME000043S07435
MYAGKDYFHARQKLLYVNVGITACSQKVGPRYKQLKYAMQKVTPAITVLNSKISSGSSSGGKAGQLPVAYPLSAVEIDLETSHASVNGNNFAVRFDEDGGARIRSRNAYSSGIFSAQLQCPRGDTSGMDFTFYLSTKEGDSSREAATFDFVGNDKTLVALKVAQNGQYDLPSVVQLGFDCSAAFHTYTIQLSSNSIIWKVDNTVLRILTRSDAASTRTRELFPDSVPMYLYMNIWDASQLWDAPRAGPLTLENAPYTGYYKNVLIASPVSDAQMPPLPAIIAGPRVVVPFAIDYCFQQVDTRSFIASHQFSIKFDNSGCGGRFRSTRPYAYGTFSGKVKCPSGRTDGLVTSFYLSSLEGSNAQHEIDFEWLGRYSTKVQTNFYVNGVGGNEELIDLGFDCRNEYHTYTIVYASSSIKWYIDNKLARTVLKSNSRVFPSLPTYLYGSIWDASSINGGQWTGSYNGVDAPYYLTFKDVTITA